MNSLIRAAGLAPAWRQLRWRTQLPLSRKVFGPEHRETIRAMRTLAAIHRSTGRREETLKLTEEILTLQRKVLGPEHPDTVRTMANLAVIYEAAGRIAEAVPLLAKASEQKPEDTGLALKLAALQVWFGKDEDYAATRARMIQSARTATKPDDFERVAKLASLRPVADVSPREAALTFARRSVELGQGHQWMSYFQLSLGLTSYRSGLYRESERALLAAAETAPSLNGEGRACVEGIAGFYRAMSLYQQGQTAEARALLTATEMRMKPFPADDQNPLAPQESHDVLIMWLACKEARALLGTGG